MIAPDTASGLRAERRFDLASAALIGVIAVLAAILAIVQVDTSQNATRAQQQAATLASDLGARLQTTSMTQAQILNLEQASLALGIQGLGRQISALAAGDEGAQAVGVVEQSTADKLSAAITATAGSSGGSPLDSYTASMVNATTADLLRELAEQNRQADLADEYGARNTLAVLGLSFIALAGVLVGLAAVLREGRAGWFTLSMAALMSVAAASVAVLAVAAPVWLLNNLGLG